VKGGGFTGFIYTVLRCHISDQINHRLFYQIPRKRANSTAQLEIPRHAENCGPYPLRIFPSTLPTSSEDGKPLT